MVLHNNYTQASNAVKFVKKGYICLQAKTVNGSVEISVSDSGSGIPEQKRQRLFQKFQSSLDELNQGTGEFFFHLQVFVYELFRELITCLFSCRSCRYRPFRVQESVGSHGL